MLNPGLFARIKYCIGDVAVVNSGSSANVYHSPDWSRGGKLRARVTGGQQFRTNCPYCSDTRMRLYIHHLYDQVDEKTGFDHRYLAYCQNEACLIAEPDRYADLWDRLSIFNMAFDMGASQVKVKKSVEQLPPIPIFSTLPPSIPIISSRVPREAVDYLEHRGFSSEELWELWHVRYCGATSKSKPRIPDDRILFPCYDFEDLEWNSGAMRIAGWQARRLSDDSEKPKYLFAAGMQKSKHLYGVTRALHASGPIVVCEGVTDVWRLRDNAIATFGKKVSMEQANRIVALAKARPAVIFADRDAEQDANELREKLEAAASGSITVRIALPPPGKKDPGDCTREEAWDCVAAALNKPFSKLGIDLATVRKSKHPRMLIKRSALA